MSSSPKKRDNERRKSVQQKSEAYREKLAVVASHQLSSDLLRKATLSDADKIALAQKEKEADADEKRRKSIVHSQFSAYKKPGTANKRGSIVRRSSTTSALGRRASSSILSRSREGSMDSVNEDEASTDQSATARPLSVIRDEDDFNLEDANDDEQADIAEVAVPPLPPRPPPRTEEVCFSPDAIAATYGRKPSQEFKDKALPPLPPKLPPKKPTITTEVPVPTNHNQNARRKKEKCIISTTRLCQLDLNTIQVEGEPLIVKASVWQLRKKGKLFSKRVWKQVWIFLKKVEIELYKDIDLGTLHGLFQLNDITSVEGVIVCVSEGQEGGADVDAEEDGSSGNENTIETPGFTVSTGEESWTFRCNDVGEREAWLAAILHNMHLVCTR